MSFLRSHTVVCLDIFLLFYQVELFARYFNWIEKPHRMENSANYHLFKDGIKPMWEDPANANVS